MLSSLKYSSRISFNLFICLAWVLSALSAQPFDLQKGSFPSGAVTDCIYIGWRKPPGADGIRVRLSVIQSCVWKYLWRLMIYISLKITRILAKCCLYLRRTSGFWQDFSRAEFPTRFPRNTDPGSGRFLPDPTCAGPGRGRRRPPVRQISSGKM